MEIKELSKAKAKELKGLSSKKERDRLRLFLAEGDKCVKDILGNFDLVYLTATKGWISENSTLVARYENELFVADKKTIGLFSSMASLPDVAAVFRIPSVSEEIPILEKKRIFLLLDEIQDPGNLGTIVRTCDWFGIYDIFASKNTVDLYGPKVVKATMGSLSRVKVHYVNLKELILKNRELKLVGTLLNGTSIYECDQIREGMILMGNEGRGISEDLKKYIDIPVTIPPENSFSHPDSLNVAIATAIVISQIKK